MFAEQSTATPEVAQGNQPVQLTTEENLKTAMAAVIKRPGGLILMISLQNGNRCDRFITLRGEGLGIVRLMKNDQLAFVYNDGSFKASSTESSKAFLLWLARFTTDSASCDQPPTVCKFDRVR